MTMAEWDQMVEEKCPNYFDKLGVPTWLEFQSMFGTPIGGHLSPAQTVRIYEQVVSAAIWDYLKGRK